MWFVFLYVEFTVKWKNYFQIILKNLAFKLVLNICTSTVWMWMLHWLTDECSRLFFNDLYVPFEVLVLLLQKMYCHLLLRLVKHLNKRTHIYKKDILLHTKKKKKEYTESYIQIQSPLLYWDLVYLKSHKHQFNFTKYINSYAVQFLSCTNLLIPQQVMI